PSELVPEPPRGSAGADPDRARTVRCPCTDDGRRGADAPLAADDGDASVLRRVPDEDQPRDPRGRARIRLLVPDGPASARRVPGTPRLRRAAVPPVRAQASLFSVAAMALSIPWTLGVQPALSRDAFRVLPRSSESWKAPTSVESSTPGG